MLTMIERAVRVLRYRRRWGALAAAAERKADLATALLEKSVSRRREAAPASRARHDRPS